MGRIRQLRTRVAFAIAALAILVVSAHSVALYLTIEEREEDQIDRIVTDEMEYLLERLRFDPSAPPHRTQNLESYVVRSAGEQARLPPAFRERSIGQHEIYDNGHEWHLAVRAYNGARVYLAYDATKHERQIREFAWLLGFGVLATALASALLGYALAGLLTRPVSDLARRVGSLTPGAAPEPLAARFEDDELRQLAKAFDEYRARMAEYVAREQEFTANVSHELRTPLTAIRTGAELLAAREQLPESARERARRIQKAAERLGATVQSLLWLARASTPAAPETFALRDSVEEALEPLRDLAQERRVVLRNDVGAGERVRADRAAWVMVVTNLARNAVQGTRDGSVSVGRLADGALEIADTGAGIPPEDLPRVFERFYRGRGDGEGEGHGLGLAIVKRLCDQHGWSVAIASEPGRGTRVTVRLTGSA